MAFILVLTPNAFGKTVIKVRVNEAPPQYMQENGKWIGFKVELMEALLREAGITPEYRKLPWARALEELAHGTIDVMMNVGYSPERSQKYYFIWPKTSEKQVLVTRKDLRIEVKTLDDFKLLPQKVIFERGNIFGNRFNRKYKNDKDFRARFHPIDTPGNLTELVLLGRRSGELNLLENVRYEMQSDPRYKDLIIQPVIVSEIYTYFAFSKKSVSKELLLRLHGANIRALSNGSYEKVFDKWEN